MKKVIALFIIFVCVGSALSAQIKMAAAGGGALFDMSFGNGGKAEESPYRLEVSENFTSFGAFGFIDLIYAEIDVYLAYGQLTRIWESNIPSTYGNGSRSGNSASFGFTLLGKYPIELSPFTIFPLLGIGYNFVLSYKLGTYEEDKPGDYSQFGFLGGVGMDFPLSDKYFLRAEGLLVIRLSSKYYNDLYNFSGAETTLGIGPRIKVAVGFHL